MTKSEKREEKDRRQSSIPLSATHPLAKTGRKEREEISEATNAVDKTKEKKKLVLTGIFRCYVLAVPFVEFMVFQWQTRLRLLLYWSQLVSDWQLIYCQLRKV
jgi:hypothetical protein